MYPSEIGLKHSPERIQFRFETLQTRRSTSAKCPNQIRCRRSNSQIDRERSWSGPLPFDPGWMIQAVTELRMALGQHYGDRDLRHLGNLVLSVNRVDH